MSSGFYTLLLYSLILSTGLAIIIFLIRYFIIKPGQSKQSLLLYSLMIDVTQKTVHLRYKLAETGKMKICIEDKQGHNLYDLLNETQQAGTYNFDFDVKLLPAGEYFINITTDKMNRSKKFIIQ
jgi:hypothetical protein